MLKYYDKNKNVIENAPLMPPNGINPIEVKKRSALNTAWLNTVFFWMFVLYLILKGFKVIAQGEAL